MNKIARKTKRFLSLFMVLMMVVSLIPASSLNVYAGELSTDVVEVADVIEITDVNDQLEIEETSTEQSVNEVIESVDSDDENSDVSIIPSAPAVETGSIMLGDNWEEKTIYAKDEVYPKEFIENVDVSEDSLLADSDSPVIVKWSDSKDGTVDFEADEKFIGSKYTQKIYLNGEVVNKNTDTLDVSGFIFDIAYYMRSSGRYKVGIVVDGIEYTTEEWDYVRPNKSVPEIRNFELDTDEETGKPIGMTFDYEAGFENNDFKYNFILYRGFDWQGSCIVSFSDCEVNGRRVSFKFPDWWDDYGYWVKDSRYTLNIYVESNNIENLTNDDNFFQYKFAWGDLEEQLVEVEWNGNNGYVHISFNKEPNDKRYREILYRDDDVVQEYSMTYEHPEYWFNCASSISESGRYKFVLIVDGQEYSTSELDYVRPAVSVPDITNLNWIMDENNNLPIGISFDYNDTFADDNYYYIYNMNAVFDKSIYTYEYIYYQDCIIDDGRIYYYFPELWDSNKVINDQIDLSLRGETRDISIVAGNSKHSELSIVVGNPQGIPVGPQDMHFDSDTGILKYTVGDAKSEFQTGMLYYDFSLEIDGEYKYVDSIIPAEKGTVCEINLAGFMEGSGEYKIVARASWYVGSGHNQLERKYVGFESFKYEKPEGGELDAPTGLKFDGKKFSWNPVEGAGAYSVRLDFDYTYSGNVYHYSKNISDVIRGTSFDVVGFIANRFPKATNFHFEVVAIPGNINEKCKSQSVGIGTHFNNVNVKMIVGDPNTGKADIHLVSVLGTAVSGVTYSSSDESVATVNSSGVVTAVGAGTVTITANVTGYAMPMTMDINVISGIYSVDYMDSNPMDVACGDIIPEIVSISPITAKIKHVVVSSTNNDLLNVIDVKYGDTERIEYTVAVCMNVAEPTSEKVSVFVVDENDREFSVSKTYNILPSEIEHKVGNIKGYAYPAAAKTLANVTLSAVVSAEGELEILNGLPNGWAYENPNQNITKYAGMSSAKFSVYYLNSKGQKEYDYLDVEFYTPTMTDFDSIPLVMKAGKYEEKIVFDDSTPVEIFKDYVLTSSNNEVVSVESVYDNENIFSVVAKKKGTAVLTYKVSGVVVATKKITVVSNSLNNESEIKYDIRDLNGDVTEISKIILTDDESSKQFTLQNTIEDDYTMNVLSSDTSVLKIVNGSKISGDKKATLNFIAAGTATLSLVVNDEAKTTKKILVHVADRSTKENVSISTNVVSFDSIINEEYNSNIITAFNDGERVLVDAQLYETKYFDNKYAVKPETKNEMQPVSAIGVGILSDERNMLSVFVCDGFTVNDILAGKYVLSLGFSDSREDFYEAGFSADKTFYLPITVKKTTTKPKYGFDQLNVYDSSVKGALLEYRVYDDRYYDGVVTAIEGLETEDFISEDGILAIKNLKGKKSFNVTVESGYYKPTKVKVNVKADTTKYSLKSSSGIYYTDIGDTYPKLDIVAGKSKEIYNISGKNPIVKIVSNDSSYETKVIDGEIFVKLKSGITPKASEKLTITYSDNYLAAQQTFTYTVKAVSLNKAKLVTGAKSLTMYDYVGKEAVVKTTIKLAGDLVPTEYLNNSSNYTISEKVDAKLGESLNQTLAVSYDASTGDFQIRKTSSNLKAGTYKFVFTVKTSDKPLSVTVPVKVVAVDGTTAKTSASVKVSVKNNANVYVRGLAGIKITPKFTNVAADAEYYISEITGKDAGMFDIVGSNELALRESVKVIEKEAYSVKVIYSVKSNGAEFKLVSNDISLKFNTPKATVKITSAGTNILEKEGCSRNIILNATSANNYYVAIDRVELVNMNDCFDIIKDEYLYKLSYTPCGSTKAGKSYTLKFNVYLKDAPANSKPITVNYTVKITK